VGKVTPDGFRSAIRGKDFEGIKLHLSKQQNKYDVSRSEEIDYIYPQLPADNDTSTSSFSGKYRVSYDPETKTPIKATIKDTKEQKTLKLDTLPYDCRQICLLVINS
jgi:hypothetical protein